jgi:hypothetical protein
MSHDVFISYSSKDKPIADGVCANLEAAGVRCWIAPRDISSGEDWPTAITEAIAISQVMVLVFSAHSNSSEQVSRELFLAANSKVVIIPFKIEDVQPEPGKLFFLGRTHWLDAMNPPTQAQINQLVERVGSFIKPHSTIGKNMPVQTPGMTPDFLRPLPRRPGWALPAAALVIVTALIITGFIILPKLKDPSQSALLTQSASSQSQNTPSPAGTASIYVDREDFNDPQFDGTFPPSVHLKDSCSNMKAAQEKGSLMFQVPIHIQPDCFMGSSIQYLLNDIKAVEFSLNSSSDTPLNHPSFAFMLGTVGPENGQKNFNLICGLNYVRTGCYVRQDQQAQETYHTKMIREKMGDHYTFRIEVLDPDKMAFRFIANGETIGEFTMPPADVAAYKDLSYGIGGGPGDMGMNDTIKAGTYFIDYFAIELR